MKVRIVRIGEAHIASFRAVIDVVAREKRYLAMTKAAPFAATRKFVRNSIRTGNPFFVALAGKEVVGWCDIQRTPRDTMAHSGVLGIGLLPDYRGKGIGEELMRKTISAAWRAGFTRIELTVRVDNLNAKALYERLGFASEGVRRNAFRIDGAYTDLIAMALLKEEDKHAAAAPQL